MRRFLSWAAPVLFIVIIATIGLATTVEARVGKPMGWGLAVLVFGVVGAVEINAMLRRAPYRTRASRRLRRRATAAAEDQALRPERIQGHARSRRVVAPVRRRSRVVGEGAPPVLVRIVFACGSLAFLANFFGVLGGVTVCLAWIGFMRFLHRRRERRRLSHSQVTALADVFGEDNDRPMRNPREVSRV